MLGLGLGWGKNQVITMDILCPGLAGGWWLAQGLVLVLVLAHVRRNNIKLVITAAVCRHASVSSNYRRP